MDEYFELAVEQSQLSIDTGQGGPFGATLVRGEQVVVAVGNRQLAEADPSQHAEMVAVREGCRILGTPDLSDCVMYATCEPCPMCVAVMIWAGIKDCFYSATRHDAEKHGFGDQHLRRFFAGQDDTVIRLVPVAPRPDCADLFTRFHQMTDPRGQGTQG